MPIGRHRGLHSSWEHGNKNGKRRPQSPQSGFCPQMLTLQPAKCEWAWITVFSTSQVQSVLCLDRQLETGSTGCQTLQGRGGATAKNVLFLPPLTAAFQETIQSSRVVRLTSNPVAKFIEQGNSPAACDSWVLSTSESYVRPDGREGIAPCNSQNRLQSSVKFPVSKSPSL